jgi:CrcB protein
VINATGSFALGVAFALSVEHARVPPELGIPIMLGFLGSYTTFSTPALDTWRLGEGGSVVSALVNRLGSLDRAEPPRPDLGVRG